MWLCGFGYHSVLHTVLDHFKTLSKECQANYQHGCIVGNFVCVNSVQIKLLLVLLLVLLLLNVIFIILEAKDKYMKKEIDEYQKNDD